MLPEILAAWSPSDLDSVYLQYIQDPQATGFVAITAVGLVLGLLGGGGSILALPIFMLAFHHPTDVAMAESLAVVSVGAAVGFVSHLRAGTVDLAVASPFAALAMTGSYFGSQMAVGVPQHHRAQPHDLALTTDSDHQWPTSSAHEAGPMSGTDLTIAADLTTETEGRENLKDENNFFLI